ncbi:MAG: outer membrane homotrimeric porin [Desulfovibrio sp.]|nr:outer membrane homotrimeric porin [Desulfovibrio sp.]
MKKLAVLLIASGLLLGASTSANAIDFKMKGRWVMSFDYGKNGAFTGGNGMTGFNGKEDEFEARQRVRIQMDAVASENLKGQLYFEIGKTIWGQAKEGGALGADGKTIKVRRAFIDWKVPETDLKVRMGLQGLGLPAAAIGTSQVFVDDVAAVTLSYRFNENVALTAFWARPYNDNYDTVNGLDKDGNPVRLGTNGSASFMDNVDMGALVLPLTFDGVKLTPWFAMAGIGPNALASDTNYNAAGEKKTVNAGSATSWKSTLSGMLPAWGIVSNKGQMKYSDVMKDKYATAWWAGLCGDITYWDPFRIAFDFAAGGVNYGKSRMNRAGWLAALLFEYKMDWGIPGLYGWYSSGDNKDAGDGSERLPYLSLGNGKNAFSSYAWDGHPDISREFVMGHGMAGTWGIGARLKDVSFLEDLKHTFRINYIGGTNKHGLLKKVRKYSATNGVWSPAANAGGVGVESLYLTDLDSVMEFGFTTTYKMYENFEIRFDASYLAVWLDDSSKTWAQTGMNGAHGSRDVRDCWNLSLSFAYSF